MTGYGVVCVRGEAYPPPANPKLSAVHTSASPTDGRPRRRERERRPSRWRSVVGFPRGPPRRRGPARVCFLSFAGPGGEGVLEAVFVARLGRGCLAVCTADGLKLLGLRRFRFALADGVPGVCAGPAADDAAFAESASSGAGGMAASPSVSIMTAATAS